MLRIGILECDHVDERFRGIAGDYFAMFSTLLNRHDIELVGYDVHEGVLPPAPDECDGWIATGSRRSAYDDLAWIHALAAFVRDVRRAAVPYAGICFGHQLLAHALGGRVERAGEGWGVGVHRMQLVGAAVDSWPGMARLPSAPSCSLVYMHQDQVTLLPEGATLLGGTDHCPIAMYRVGDHMLGIQAHPEFGSAYVRALLEDRVDRIGAAKTSAALRTLGEHVDTELMANWLVGFLAGDGCPST